MDDRKYRSALRRLYDARLILTTEPMRPVDCHPLIREHFAAEATSENHARLYEYYKGQAPEKPNTLEEMTPLFYAVYHGCQAGRHQSVCGDVYFACILREDEFYLTVKLGAFGTDLSLLANFFDTPWIRPGPGLSTASRASVFEQVGYVLGALGRFGDAEGPLRAATELYVGSENWELAARTYGHLSIHKSKLGDLQAAVAAAQQATAYADRSGVWFQRLLSRTKLALGLHLSGDAAAAIRIFSEAEHIQAEGEPGCPILYGVHGHRYCELLLDQGQTEEVLYRASQALPWEAGRLQQIGLDHLLIGRAHPVGSVEAACHLDLAVDFLRRAGHLESLPYGLLGRGTEHDLEEVHRIATRTGMRLFLADYHIASARLALSAGESAQSRAHIEKAKTLVRETGYHRRDRDIDQIDGELGV
jgi:tetratricopeptide (TPR) repeat protein